MLSFRRIKKVAFLSISLTLVLTSETLCSYVGFFDDFKQGDWRFESLGGLGLSGPAESDRKGDYYFAGSLEYEWSIYGSRTNVGIRLYPAFIYHQEENDKGDTDTVFGEALGVDLRRYQYINNRGCYWEIGVSTMWNSRLFRNNAARWNFLSEIGIGYKFDSDWHVALKFQHISNAETRSPNAGVNALALCLGFTF